MAEDEAKREEHAPPAGATRAAAPEPEEDDPRPDEDPAVRQARPPRVWLQWNAKRGLRYGHVPTEGSGVGGELTPDEVQQYFGTRAFYDQAVKVDQSYSRVPKAELRDPAGWWKSTNPDAYGPKEGGADGES